MVSASDENSPRVGYARLIAAAGSLIIGAVAVSLWFGRGEALGVRSFDVISDANVVGTIKPTGAVAAAGAGNRCILCYQQGATSATGCTLDNGKSWLLCPKERPYLAEISKSCGEKVSWCSKPTVPDCLDCGNSCKVGAQTLKCGLTTPVYVFSQSSCASVCTANPLVISGPTVPLGPAATTAATTAAPTMASVTKTTTKQKPAFCATVTAGTCKLMSCSSSRGQVNCNKDYKCECKPGACVDNEGKCSIIKN